MATHVLQVLALQRNQDLESTLFRFKTGWSVRIVYGSTLFGQTVRLFINYPADNTNYVRTTYRELAWKKADEQSHASDQTSLAVDIKLLLPGTFRYYFELASQPGVVCGSGYFLVEPLLKLGNGAEICLDNIQCQSVLSKCLGPFESWKDVLMVSEKSGYNVIHFTPVQELGGSNSAYSLKDQLRLNPKFSMNRPPQEPLKYSDIGELVELMQRDWGVLSITDIVLNHTANETPWIQEHPECGYNLTNSPHLRPAFLLDRVLWHATLDIISGKWEPNGLTKEIASEANVSKLKEILIDYYLAKAKIYEMHLIDIEAVIDEFKCSLAKLGQKTKSEIDSSPTTTVVPSIKVIQDPDYRRNKSMIDIIAATALFTANLTNQDEISKANWREASCRELRQKLEAKNHEITNEINGHLYAAIENVACTVRYERLQRNGPKIKAVSRTQPLVPQFFTFFLEDQALEEEEVLIYDGAANVYFMAHNGWVMDYDPLKNFAMPGSNVYIRRELIAWGDSVKLRYGNGPEDVPFLWNLMKEYVEMTARTFHGIRLDNCHSTPMHLAEYLIDAARAIRPHLYVIAELFTCSEHLDNLFVNHLGINSLIRESVACCDAHELGRLVHRFGGDPVGAFMKPTFKPLQKTFAHAVFFDLTHDNESTIAKRSAYDLLATSAVIAMSSCATGSNRGYDELVPHHINVVNEERRYGSWPEEVNYETGIVRAKSALNDLHLKLGQEGYSEIFVDQVDGNVIAVTRHNPANHKSVVLVARTCFSYQEPTVTGFIKNVAIAGKINEILFEARMNGCANLADFSRNESMINGLRGFVGDVRQNLKLKQSALVSVTTNGKNGENSIRFEKFTPGSVIAFDVSLDANHLEAIGQLKKIIASFDCEDGGGQSEIGDIVSKLDLDDLNYVLFRIDQEEMDDRFRGGTYEIPNFNRFNYCGLAGLMNHWKDIRTSNDLGHPICSNLRDGDWLLAYIAGRLQWRDSTKDLSNWMKSAFVHLSKIPRYLIPRYFDALIAPLYSLCLGSSLKKMSSFIQNGSKLAQHLAIGSLAMVGYNPSAPLPPLAESLSHRPPTRVIDNVEHPVCPSIAAGLPHFSSGYMRNWGRDTFIALRGLLLVTGRYGEARNIILGFGGCLRHGLIPNLLDRGIKARFNCRDAVWFWLQCIKDYCQMVPDNKGYALLSDPVRRLYPTDDSEAKTSSSDVTEQPLHQVMQEVLLRHFRGIDFKERNWGVKIDEQMTEEGFNVRVGVERETGFVFGGNPHNCGTWMDKMGSSSKAGNRGVPSSPRDGSAVELVGLSKSILTWVRDMKEQNIWPYEGVTSGDEFWSWADWVDRIANNFERHFYVGLETDYYLINRREIYKDIVGASEEWQDYQLRPNFLVAMAVAPEMFDKNHARRALEITRKALLGPLGMKTLDPSDWNYRGDYDNSNDSTDTKIAHGFNYHQGPEWLWPVGYYLRAQYVFASDKTSAKNHINEVLAAHYQHLEKSSWLGLPELTNSNGSHCSHSCETQAWSISTLLDTIYDVQFERQ